MSDQMDLFSQPRARRADPETSHEAAASIEKESIQMTQLRVLHCLDTIGSQDDLGIAQWYEGQNLPRVSPSGLRTRRSELVARGLVRFSGHYGKSSSGRRTRIWEITKSGHALVSVMDMSE